MKNYRQLAYSLLFGGILSFTLGCQPQPPLLPTEFQEFITDQSVPVIQAQGRILLKTASEQQRGEARLNLFPQSYLQIQVFAPIIGTVLYEIRTSAQQFMVLDYSNKQYVLEDNTMESRQRWMGMDVTAEELSWVIWGRLPKSSFQGWNGNFISKDELVLRREHQSYRLTRGPHGLLSNMKKYEDGLLLYEVNITSYQQFKNQWFPKKLKLTDTFESNQLTLVFTDIDTTQTFEPSIDFSAPQDMERIQHQVF